MKTILFLAVLTGVSLLFSRAIACVNAMAGIPDPAKWRKEMEAKLAEQGRE